MTGEIGRGFVPPPSSPEDLSVPPASLWCSVASEWGQATPRITRIHPHPLTGRTGAGASSSELRLAKAADAQDIGKIPPGERAGAAPFGWNGGARARRHAR